MARMISMDDAVEATIVDWRSRAVRALKRMFLPEQGVYAFRLRRGPDGQGQADQLEGVSYRYTAIVLLALVDESEQVRAEALPGASPEAVCDRLIAHADVTEDLGEVALTLWAARRLEHPRAEQVLKRLVAMEPMKRFDPTVETSWALTSLVVPGRVATDPGLAEAFAHRLLATGDTRTGLFAHWPAGAKVPALRGHVCCFADMVYPVQALSYYYQASGRADARDAALRCGERMCALQGPAGQWWWHFDIRTGRVVEKYPVYAVHQDAMAPMALFALQEACGGDYREAIRRGVEWLVQPVERAPALVDPGADVIWRKVCRREPGKLVRGLQAGLSAVQSSLRVPAVDAFFPPTAADWETRPYHMGWLLHAWSGDWPARLG